MTFLAFGFPIFVMSSPVHFSFWTSGRLGLHIVRFVFLIKNQYLLLVNQILHLFTQNCHLLYGLMIFCNYMWTSFLSNTCIWFVVVTQDSWTNKKFSQPLHLQCFWCLHFFTLIFYNFTVIYHIVVISPLHRILCIWFIFTPARYT